MRILTIVALIAVLWAQGAEAEDRALVIGVDRYTYMPDANLEGAANDARAMAGLLIGTFGLAQGQVRVLVNDAARREDILREAQEWLVEGTAPGDRVWLTFSGHGYHVADESGDEEDGLDEVIVPSDASWNSNRTELHDYISDDEIAALVGRLPGRRISLVFDSCYSGTMSRSPMPAFPSDVPGRSPAFGDDAARDLEVVAAHGREQPLDGMAGAVLWTAVAPLQLAPEDRAGEPRGVFTTLFVDGLSGAAADRNRDGIVSHAEVLAHVRDGMRDYCSEHVCRGRETPSPTLEAPASLLGADVRTGAVAARLEDRVTDILVPDRPWPISVDGAAEAQVGDHMIFTVTSERSGWLTLLDAHPDGSVTILYPGPGVPDSGLPVEAGVRAHVPDGMPPRFVLNAAEPLGESLIVAIVTSDPVDLRAVVEASADGGTTAARDLVVVPPQGADDLFDGLAETLARIWTLEPNNRGIAWSFATLRYTVDP